MEVLQEIRGSKEFADLPVAVLSSCVSPEEKNRIDAFGKTCIITKPGNLDGFLNVGKRIRNWHWKAKRAERERYVTAFIHPCAAAVNAKGHSFSRSACRRL